MLLYRVFPHLPSAQSPSDPGHALYIHKPQGKGRLDNPAHYSVLYLAQEASGATGETFGDLDIWEASMFDVPFLPGSKRALATVMIPDDKALLDLDDARVLVERGLRPTQVIERNRSVTQQWALRIFEERNSVGDKLWAGIRWWSYHRPSWRIVGLWDHSDVEVKEIESLSTSHVAIVDAAATLRKRVV